VGATTILAV